jgi:hypothetical protein
VLLAVPAAAQGSAGSESGVILSHETIGLGGLSLAVSGGSNAATLGQVGTGPIATSESFILLGGVSWTVPEVSGTAPIVFGARETTSDKDGGQVVEVLGFNFLAPGAGPLDVTFGGQSGTGTTVVSNTLALTTTPGAVTALGNPPPVAALGVDNALGSHLAASSPISPSFAYEPALIRTDHARVGRPLHLHLFTEQAAAILLAIGQTIPGVGVQLLPVEGSAETLINVQIAVPLTVLPGDQFTHTINVPDVPALTGLSLTYQGVAFTSLAPLAGAFSNPLTLLIQP